MYEVPHFVGGKTIFSDRGGSRDIYNPAYGKVIGRVGFSDEAFCHETVAIALKAFEGWSATPAIKRVQILFKFRDLLEKNKEDLAKLVSKEHGKSIEDAKGSVSRGIELVEHHCGLIVQLQGTYSNNVAQKIDCYTLKQPLGVCLGISPFNFPVMVPLWMMIPAIACGNTFILKPSEQDPSPPIRLLQLLQEAGLPDGVANCLQGDKNSVDILLHHPQIAAVTAVASTPVAESIYKTAIATGKRAHTFGGAKNHAVIMPDADFEQASHAIIGAAFGSAGERCMALSVAVCVGEETANALKEVLIPKIKAIHIGPGDQSTCEMGPLISSAHHQRVIQFIEQGLAEGAQLVMDGRHYHHPECPNGFFLGPSLFDAVTESMSIYQQEIFGPVLVMIRVNHFEEAIELINRHQYGNGTAIFTQNGYFAREFVERVNVGMVGINIPIPVPIVSHPFGGFKRSSFGDTPMHGQESIHFYTKLKSVTCKWPTTELENQHFNMPIHR